MAQYDAFISYARDADEKFAPELKTAMLKLGKKWNKRRALSVFLDKDALESSAGLRDSLQDALDKSRFLVILASPASASSKWVGEEVEHWKNSGKSANQILLVLTEGTIAWDDAVGDFDFAQSTAVGDGLRGVFSGEPLWSNMADFAQLDDLDIRSDAGWKNTVATLAAPLHPPVGNPPKRMEKEDLVGVDLVQFKRAKLLRRLAVSGLVALTVLAIIGFTNAVIQQRRAETEARRAESRAIAAEALNNAQTDRDLSALLALEGVRVADTSQARGSLLGILGFPSRFQERTQEHPDQPVTAIAFDRTGKFAATGDSSGKIVMWSVDPDDPLNPATVRDDINLDVSPSGVGDLLFVDLEGQLALIAVANGQLDAWDAVTGEVLDDLEPPEFAGEIWASTDLSLFVGVAPSGGIMAVKDIVDTDVDEVPLLGGDSARVVNAAVASSEAPGERPTLAWVEQETSEGRETLVMRNGQGDDPVEVENRFVSGITSMAFSPDGSLLVVGEVDGGILLFDVAMQSLVGQMEPRPVTAPVSLVFDPTGFTAPFTLASAHSNGEVLLWQVFEDGGVLTDGLLGHNEVITSLAFGAGGQIASGSFEGEVIWWNAVPQFVLGNKIPSSGDLHGTDIAQVAFLDDDNVFSLDDNGNLLLTGVTDGVGALMPDIEPGAVTGIDAASSTFAAGLIDGSVVLLIDDEEARTIETGTERVDFVQLSDDGRELATVAAETIAIWDAETGDLRSSLGLPDDFVPWSVLHPGGDEVWLGGNDTQGPLALRFDASTGAMIEPPLRHGTAEQGGATAVERVVSMAVSSDGELLVTGGSDRKIVAWNLDTMERSGGSFIGHNEAVTGLAFIENDERLLSSDDDLVMNYWDVSERRLITSFRGPTDGINDLALSPDEMTLAVASEDDFVYTWTLDASAWIERACLLSGRNMTEAEWKLYGRGSYVRHCGYPGEGPLADYGRILSSPSAPEDALSTSAGDATTSNEAENPDESAPPATALSPDATDSPATTATMPATTVEERQPDQPQPLTTVVDFELDERRFDTVDVDVQDGAISFGVAVGETTSPDVDLYVYAPGTYTPGTAPDNSVAICDSAEDGSLESCVIGDPEPGRWIVLVQNFAASDAPPDSIEVVLTVAVE